MLKVSPIKFNQTNRIPFKAEENKETTGNEASAEESKMSTNTKIGIGVSAAVALAALGYAGYKGHLGSGIKKMLGGATEAVENATAKNNDVTPPSIKNPEGGSPKPTKSPEGGAPKQGGETPPNGSNNKSPKVEVNPVKTEEVTTTKATEVIAPAGKPVETTEKIEVPKTVEVNGAKLPTEMEKLIIATEAKIDDIEKEFGGKNGVFANNENKEKALGAIDDHFESLNLSESDPANVDLSDKIITRMLNNYSDVLEQEGNLSMLKFSLSEVKLMKNDLDAAEKLLREAFVSPDAHVGVKVEVFKNMHKVAVLQGKPEKAVQFFAENTKLELEEAATVQETLAKMIKEGVFSQKRENIPEEARKLCLTFGMHKGLLKSFLKDLTDVYGKENESIKAMQKVLDKMIETI